MNSASAFLVQNHLMFNSDYKLEKLPLKKTRIQQLREETFRLFKT